MAAFASVADRDAIEAEAPWDDRGVARTMYEFLSRAAAAHGAAPGDHLPALSGPEGQGARR